MAKLVGNAKNYTLDGQPCCMEFLPAQHNWMIIGTYQLIEKDTGTIAEASHTLPVESSLPQTRAGSIILAKIVDGEFKVHQELHTNYSILDLKFHPFSPYSFVCACSGGQIAFFQIGSRFGADPGTDLLFTHRTTIQLFEPEYLVTSVTWNVSAPQNLAATLTDGSIRRILLAEPEASRRLFPVRASLDARIDTGFFKGSDVEWLKTKRVYAHDLEAWIVNFVPGTPDVVSGGDDGCLRGSRIIPAALLPPDRAAALGDEPAGDEAWSHSKLHGAGVVAVTPISPSILITGSYDNHIRLISMPHGPDTSNKRQVLAELDLGGGVWRIKVMDMPIDQWAERYDLLVCCMQSGGRIVRLSREPLGKWQFEVLMRWEHDLNYASDYQPGQGVSNERLIVSTSFYDRLVSLRRIRID